MEKLMHLIAFFLPIVIFSYFTFVGYAAISLFRSQQNPLQNLLLSPAVGLSFTLMAVFWLNRAGLPVNDFATLLTIFLMLASTVIFLFVKPFFPFKPYSLFIGIFIIALWLVGRPLLSFGFDWMSYGNEDMAGYCLGAFRFLNHGYFDIPNADEIIQGKDKSQYYWFTFVPAAVRSGCELLLAWVSGLVRLNPLQIFMPLIISFHLTLISVTGAMLLSSKSWYKIALTACLFLAFSALSTLGVLYELIAQVAGLTVFIAVCILLFETFTKIQTKDILRHSLLLCIVSCALLIIYPELASILVLTFIAYFIINLLSDWRITKEFVFILGLCLCESALFLNKYWLNILIFLQYQVTEGFTDLKGGLFPYFLMPSGLADLWGAQTIASISEGWWGSISIILGFCMSILALLFAIRQISKRYPAAVVTLVMTALAFYLLIRFKQESGFALFKLSMYVQPFLLSVMAIGLFEKTSRLIKASLIVLIVILGAYSQRHYMQYSYGDFGKPFVELPGASSSHLYTELVRLKSKLPLDADIISDTPNVISSKLQSLYLADKKIHFYSNPLTFYSRYIYTGKSLFMRYSPNLYQEAMKLKDKLMALDPELAFVIKDSNDEARSSIFYKSHSNLTSDSMILMDSPLRSILNRRELSDFNKQNYVAKRLSEVNNHLIFINSSLGQYYYFGENPYISLNGMEKDYYFPNNTISGIGRYLLFQVINPTKKYRLEVNLTESLSHDGSNLLPQVKIIGDKVYHISQHWVPLNDSQGCNSACFLFLQQCHARFTPVFSVQVFGNVCSHVYESW